MQRETPEGWDMFPKMAIETKLVGGANQVVVCQLGPGQCVFAESGRFLWKTANVGVVTEVTR